MGDGVGFSADDLGLGFLRLEAKHREQREDEEIARLGGTSQAFAEGGDFGAIPAPEGLGGGPSRGDFVFHLAGRRQAEVGGLLRVFVLPRDGIE